MTTFIYGIVDPRTDQLRYIGKTINLKQRYQDHLRDKRCTRRSNFIQSILNSGNKPDMFVIEEVEDSNWQNSERFWISYFKFIGANLVNATDGGDKNWTHLPEVRKKMSENCATKRPEVKAKLREHQRLKNPENAKRHSEIMKKFFLDHPEHKQEVVDRLHQKDVVKRQAESKRGRPLSDEHKRKISAFNKGRIRSPEVIKRTVETRLSRYGKSENKKQYGPMTLSQYIRSEKIKLAWERIKSDPERMRARKDKMNKTRKENSK